MTEAERHVVTTTRKRFILAMGGTEKVPSSRTWAYLNISMGICAFERDGA